MLNAKQHTREAHIVAQAGRLGAVTVATNMAGRGVDILLGGNPEGLAEPRGARRGARSRERGGPGRATPATSSATKRECRAEGDKVRELGGLYVLGTERHESRRIDNQLRGRSGRQGDPGESRFYLSLEDELMRLFATGAMSWVMGRALPDDVPIEAKMVTQGHRAGAEHRRAAQRRDPQERPQVRRGDERAAQGHLQAPRSDPRGADLQEEAIEYLADAVDATIDTYCVADFAEEWDLDGLVTEIQTFWPSKVTIDELRDAGSTDEMYDLLMSEATAHYEEREAELGEDDDARGRAPGDVADHRPAVA